MHSKTSNVLSSKSHQLNKTLDNANKVHSNNISAHCFSLQHFWDTFFQETFATGAKSNENLWEGRRKGTKVTLGVSHSLANR